MTGESSVSSETSLDEVLGRWTTERRPEDDAECERLGCEDKTHPVKEPDIVTTGMGSDLAGIVSRDAAWSPVRDRLMGYHHEHADGEDWHDLDGVERMIADRRALLGLLREAREALKEAVDTVHLTGSIRDHVDESDRTGWNVRGIETCRSPECVSDLALLARLSSLDPATTEPKEPE